MGYEHERLSAIYDLTEGVCHLCSKRLSWSNYGQHGERGAWQVDHIVPKALGGSDEDHNLAPACIPCNQEKGHETRLAIARFNQRSNARSRALSIANSAIRSTGVSASRVKRVEIVERRVTVVFKSGKKTRLS
jgi:hypothetical protein